MNDAENIVETLRDQAHRFADGPMMSTVRARVEWRAADIIEDLIVRLKDVPRDATRAMESAGAAHALGGTATHAALCWEAMINAALEED